VEAIGDDALGILWQFRFAKPIRAHTIETIDGTLATFPR
jgi:hypothetical protein